MAEGIMQHVHNPHEDGVEPTPSNPAKRRAIRAQDCGEMTSQRDQQTISARR